jgi:hypothetical protein
VRAVAEGLAEALQPRRTVLASAGLDVWQQGAEVPQQLMAPRYLAMAAYFERRGPHGALMMRRSCALQVNLDLGDDGQRAERWLVANLVSPLACATFACSPGPDVASTRALAWQGLDPTRTGFPRLLADGSSDPAEQLAAAAFDADVLLHTEISCKFTRPQGASSTPPACGSRRGTRTPSSASRSPSRACRHGPERLGGGAPAGAAGAPSTSCHACVRSFTHGT